MAKFNKDHRMLELTAMQNVMMRKTIQSYLHNFSKSAMNAKSDKKLNDSMYRGAEILKRIYDKIPSMSLYKDPEDFSVSLDMPLSRQEAGVLAKLTDILQKLHKVQLQDKTSKNQWKNLTDQFTSILIGVKDLSNTSIMNLCHKIMRKEGKGKHAKK